MSPTVHFVAGLPRAGSTLLVNLLAQHPLHHVTATNGLVSMFDVIRENWSKWSHFRAQGLDNVRPRISSSLRGMTYGFYEKELSQGRIVFDKNRAWTQHLELLEEVFQRPVKVICPVRAPKAIVASFERRFRANPLMRNSFKTAAGHTVDGRARVWLGPDGLVGSPISIFRDALDRGLQDRLVIVPYRRFVSEPLQMLDYVHQRLELPPFEYDPENVEQVTQEDDAVHGWGPGLHTVRKRVEAPTVAPWKGLLPDKTCEWIDREFADINAFSSGVLVNEQKSAS